MNHDLNLYIDDATSTVSLHEDQTLCSQLLKTITAAIPLQIQSSKIPGAGNGLFVTKDVNCGEEIFRSDPLVNCVGDGMHNLVCDHCYAYQESMIHPSGRFRSAEDAALEMKACGGCKVCYYCSKVMILPTSAASSYQANPCPDCSKGLPEESLETLSQVGVRYVFRDSHYVPAHPSTVSSPQYEEAPASPARAMAQDA